MKKCPYCAEEIQEDAVVCRYCNKDLAPIPVSPKKNYRPIILGLLALLVIAAAFGGYYYYTNYGPCGTALVEQTITDLDANAKDFDAALRLANNTSRISLAGPVANLQGIYASSQQIAYPACMTTAMENYLGGQESYIDAFLKFMADEPESTVLNRMDNAERYFTTFGDQLDLVKICAPWCK